MADDDYPITHDALLRIVAVARRLYSQDRMSADQMRDAAQMLHAALECVDTGGHNGAARFLSERHATYDDWLRRPNIRLDTE